MDAVKGRRFRLTVSLDAECHAFVEKFIRVGFFASRDQMIAAALDALARDIETSARKAALAEGLPDAEDASLEQLADMLGASDRRREN
jgi:Arc/MetJ-type ribon-helix-helix transcriptional regulator